MATFIPTTPLSVSDSNLSSSIFTAGGVSSLRIITDTTPLNSIWSLSDVIQVMNTIGETTDLQTNNTVIGLLKSFYLLIIYT